MGQHNQQQSAIVYGGLMFILLLFVLQIWLLANTLETYLGGVTTIVGPATLLSGGCFLMIFAIVRWILLLDEAPTK